MRVLALILLNLTLWSLPVEAQLWSGVLDPSRAIDWSTAGAGTVPTTRTQCGSTIAPYNGNANTINTAIQNCGANQFVLLGNGTFNLSSGITFNGKDNVTLRGGGADQTRLLFTGYDNCGGKGSHICIIDTVTQYFPESAGTTANWTSGFAKGTTSILVDNKANLQIGSTIVLHQLNDNGGADPGNDVFDCSTVNVCTVSGDGGSPTDGQYQFVVVTSISGGACPCTIGITPGLYMPNWRSVKTTQASWSNGIYITGVGVENLSVEHVSGGNPFNITFFNAQYSWVKGVRSTMPQQKHVLNFVSHHNTVRDSYFSGVTPPCANDHYGYDGWMASNNLIENNIYEGMEVPLMNEQAQQGNVYGYNFTINNNFSSSCSPTDWMQASSHDHGKGNAFNLYEGNDGNGAIRENYFGVSFFMTEFRNRWSGWEPTGVEGSQTLAIYNQARSRFHNYIGNVLGTNGYHIQYQTNAGDATGNCAQSVFSFGLGGNCDNGGSAPFPTNDPNTLPSVMRWGNCDVVTGTASCRFVSTEVPSGIAKYPNPVPASNNLPASLYLNTRPAWWKVGATTPAWPPIGPDVTGGDVTGSGQSVNTGLNGRVYKIPARLCYENVMGGTFANSTVVKTFNASLCYPTTGGNTTPPSAPTGLKVQ